MAVTHDDLAIRDRWNRWSTDLSSKLALFLVAVAVICGLASFVLCLGAEASRSEAVWLIQSSGKNGFAYQCTYSGSGRTPLPCSVAAFLVLAVAMFAQHAYLLLAVASPRPPALITWMTPGNPRSSSARSLVQQARFLFLTTWICFAITEVILLIGIVIETGHLSNWSEPRSNCVVMRPGLFAAAAVFSLTTVFLGVGFYLIALWAQSLHLEEEDMHRRGSHTSLYPSNQHQIPPTAPQAPGIMVAHENQAPSQSLPQDKYTSL